MRDDYRPDEDAKHVSAEDASHLADALEMAKPDEFISDFIAFLRAGQFEFWDD